MKDEISWQLNFNFLIALKVPPELKISILNFLMFLTIFLSYFYLIQKLLLSQLFLTFLESFFISHFICLVFSVNSPNIDIQRLCNILFPPKNKLFSKASFSPFELKINDLFFFIWISMFSPPIVLTALTPGIDENIY